MKNTMMELIKSAIKDSSKLDSLEKLYKLYDNLQYCENLNEMAVSLSSWLEKNYCVDNINFSIYDMKYDTTTLILKKGQEFFLDGENSFYFIVNTHTDVNAVIAFSAKDEEHYSKIMDDNDYIEAAFFQISPILQNGIIKKHHIESSSIDSVTNVHNRKYMIEHIHKITSLSKKNQENITLMMVGIDHFKAVIDEFDYDIGDKVLIELAKVIHGNIQDFDIVARLTGDEFLIALLNIKNEQIALDIAQNIIEQFAQTEIIVDGETLQILKKTICIGISSYPKDSADIDQVLKNADNFLYEAKNKGRSSYSVFAKDEESSIDLF